MRAPNAPNAPPLILVTWHDAWFDFDLEDADCRHSEYLVTTVGFLVAEGPRVISIAQEVLPHGEGFRAVTHIPVALIQERHELDRREL
jgi:hypothetical protein